MHVIGVLRSLSLTLKEIQHISAFYCQRPGEPIGPHLAEKLDQALRRIEARTNDLEKVRQRILDFKASHAAALAGQAELALYAADPRHQPSKLPLDSPTGVRVYAVLNQPTNGGRVKNGKDTSSPNSAS